MTHAVLKRNEATHLITEDASEAICSELVAAADQKRWIARLDTKSKVEWYRRNKQRLAREPYLDLVTNFHQRRNILQLRAAAYLLRIEYGRMDGLPRPQRVNLESIGFRRAGLGLKRILCWIAMLSTTYQKI